MPLVYLRHLQLEQRGHEKRIRAREHQARPLRSFFDPLQHGPDRFALPKPLPIVLLLPRNDRFGLSRPIKQQNQLAPLDLLHFARQQVADPSGVFVADALALPLANAQHDALLGGRDGVAPEFGKVLLQLHHVARFVRFVVPTGFFERHFRGRVLHFLDDPLEHHDADAARHVVDGDLGIHGRAVHAGQAGVNAVADEFVDLFRIQVLRGRDIPKRRNDATRVHHRLSVRHAFMCRLSYLSQVQKKRGRTLSPTRPKRAS